MLDRRHVGIIAIILLTILTAYELVVTEAVVHDVQQKTEYFFSNIIPSSQKPPTKNTYGQIKDKVAIITDTKWSSHLVPLILHYHAVLGPDWPIVFFTSPELLAEHLTEPHSQTVSSSWRRAVEEERIRIETIPAEYNLTLRHSVNKYLTDPWLWEQLAPAQHVLVFQADAILCANSERKVEDFFQWDFIGATLGPDLMMYNGGLSLRNRTMMLDILREEESWEEYKKSEEKTFGEDGWYSLKMAQRGGQLPEQKVALQFSCEHKFQIDLEHRPLGYHKVHRVSPERVPEIAKWCPEIALAEAGTL